MSGQKARAPSRCSSAGTITSMLNATPSPAPAPAGADHAHHGPCTRKDGHDAAGLAPSVRGMAMSARLSVTVITSVLTRFECGHRHDQRQDDEHHARFPPARRQTRCGSAARPVAHDYAAAQHVAQIVGHGACLGAGRAISGAHRWSFQAEDACGVIPCTMARAESYSVPRLKGASHRHLFQARAYAGGVTWPLGAIRVTRSPWRTPGHASSARAPQCQNAGRQTRPASRRIPPALPAASVRRR